MSVERQKGLYMSVEEQGCKFKHFEKWKELPDVWRFDDAALDDDFKEVCELIAKGEDEQKRIEQIAYW